MQGSYLGVSTESERSVLLIPTESAPPPPGRVAGDVFLHFPGSVDFDLGPHSFKSSAAVIECGNRDLEKTFGVLARDIADSLKAVKRRPAPQQVSQALSKWERLLRSRRRLTRDEIIGLWGELWLLLQFPEIDHGVLAWRGPEDEPVDFVGGGVGLECKTSTRRLEHYVSQDQLTRPLGDLRVLIVSLWVGEDATDGETIEDLVTSIDNRIANPVAFEAKLLETGYCRSDGPQYPLRLRNLEEPRWIPVKYVPRVREADPGISHIRFLVNLPERMALTGTEALDILGRISSASSEPKPSS